VPTTNTRRPIEGFKDADFRRSSLKKETKHYSLGLLGLRARWIWPKSLYLHLLWRHPEENSSPNLSNFFIESTRLGLSLEQGFPNWGKFAYLKGYI